MKNRHTLHCTSGYPLYFGNTSILQFAIRYTLQSRTSARRLSARYTSQFGSRCTPQLRTKKTFSSYLGRRCSSEFATQSRSQAYKRSSLELETQTASKQAGCFISKVGRRLVTETSPRMQPENTVKKIGRKQHQKSFRK
jgi:hypothetical protein